jgi:hypothetical protein
VTSGFKPLVTTKPASDDTVWGGVKKAGSDIYSTVKGIAPSSNTDAATNLPGKVLGTAEDVAQGINNLTGITTVVDSVKNAGHIIDAYEKSRASGASITDSLQAANERAKQADAITPLILQRGKEWKQNPTAETVRALGDAVAAAAAVYGAHSLSTPAVAAPADEATTAATVQPPVVQDAVGSPSWLARNNPFRARTTTAASVPSDPNFIQQVWNGENVAQAPAQAATRATVKAGGAEVGLSTAQPAGLRTLAEEPISVVNALKKTLYGQVDQAAGTDLKALYTKLDAINDKIDLEASGSPEEARLEAQRTSQMQTIDDAKAAARAKGVDVDQTLAKADALHTREMALRDVQKGFLKNVNIVSGNAAEGTPEMINVDSAVKAIQKLQDNTKFGAPRLEQAFGKEGAAQLRNDIYAAQRLGVKAVDAQKLMDRIVKGLKIAGYVGGAGAAGYELVK